MAATSTLTRVPLHPLVLHRGIVTGGGSGGDDDDSNSNNGSNSNKSRPGWRRARKQGAAVPSDSEKQQQDKDKEKEKEKDGEDTEGSSGEEQEVMIELPPEEREVMLDSASTQRDELMGPPVIPEFVPEVLVLPVTRNPIFPKFLKVIEISDPKLISKIKHRVKTGHPYAGAFLRKDENAEEGQHVSSLGEVEPIGTFVLIQEFVDLPNEGKIRLLLQGQRRIHISGELADSDVLVAKVDNIKDRDYDRSSQEIRAMCNEIIKTIRDIVKLNPLFREWVNQILDMGQRVLDNPSHLGDFGAALTSAKPEELQDVLSELDVETRLSKTLDLLKREYLQCKLQHQISQEVEEKINKSRREHMLHEQLKIIKRELGITKDDKDTVVTKFRDRIKDLKLSPEASKVVEEELNKLSFLEPSSSEFNVTRNYLDWLTSIPWGKTTPEDLSLQRAREILDEDHFGMKDVKDRILEFIAVGSLLNSVQGKIICLSGPPGVGKTSIAKSIARALGRQYYRFSVGGLHDVAEIKGHRRTYIGAMPGKPIQALKITQSSNSLILIDEIDKIGRGHNGDPTSALLELLDPEQNSQFLDHYLDVPVDMSKILYVCTANVLDTIPGPLLDRMEVIQVSGYLAEEKVEIARRYLIPECERVSGLKPGQVVLEDEALGRLIRSYSRESGVRSLQRNLSRIYRKVAYQVVAEGAKDVTITPQNLSKYLGNELFTSDRMYEETPPGVVMGLAWTSMGGAHLYIETIASPQPKSQDAKEHGRPGFRVTGQLGDVMKESSQIAYTYAKHFLSQLQPESTFFNHADINMHIPEGATPKDGPSAGITMVTALLSLALNKPITQNLAMTGEVSLTGKVLRVGGIKEKILAAKRAGITQVILPDSCKSDFAELPDTVKDGIAVHFVKHYDEVYKLAFEATPSS